MQKTTIYTIGQRISNCDQREYNIKFFKDFLKTYNIGSIIDVRYLYGNFNENSDYAKDILKDYLDSSGIKLISRNEETYLFYEVIKSINDQKEKSSFFQSHFYIPLISYINVINKNDKPIALLFNHWETNNWIKGKAKPNIKGSFCKYVFNNKIDLEILHIAPTKSGNGTDVFTNEQLFKSAYGSLLNIREDIISKSNTYYDCQEDDFNIESISGNEWRNINEESDGAAYWNID